MSGVSLCEVARELAERGLDLGGEQVAGWDRGGIETSRKHRHNLIPKSK